MAILFAGGEDFDFPNGTIPVSTTAGHFRSGYSRCCLGDTSVSAYTVYSSAFPGGSVTDCWFSCRYYSTSFAGAFQKVFGITTSVAQSKGIWLQDGPPTPGKARLVKYDGTTDTVLATETGNSLIQGSMHKIDIQIIAYGAAGTVNVYVDQNLIMT